VLCSCLATHALMKQLYGINRQLLPGRNGAYIAIGSPNTVIRCCVNVNTRFDAPHSRYNAITAAQLEAAGLTILVEGEDAGRTHGGEPRPVPFYLLPGPIPNMNYNSLLKEYKREVLRFIRGELDSYPPHPENYFRHRLSHRG